jgi:hypothetical protein
VRDDGISVDPGGVSRSDDYFLYPSVLDYRRPEPRRSWWYRLREELACRIEPDDCGEARRSEATWAIRRYQDELASRSRNVLASLARNGWWLGPAPYGYRLQSCVTDDGHGRRVRRNRLVVDDDRAPVVRTIFTWWVRERVGCSAIASRLAADGQQYPPPVDHSSGSAMPWTPVRVHTILSNPAYLGYAVWGRVRQGRPCHPENWVWSTAPSHPALVEPEWFWTYYNRHFDDRHTADSEE